MIPSGSDTDLRDLATAIATRWAVAGIDGSFSAHHLGTGRRLDIGPGRAWPLASVVKVPIAAAAAAAMEAGGLDPTARHRIRPPERPRGVSGLAVFTHPAELATADLLYLMLALSDNVAADLVLDTMGYDAVHRSLAGWGLHHTHVRQPMSALYAAAVGAAGDDFGPVLDLAVDGVLPDGRHRLPALDVTMASVSTPADLDRLLGRLWADDLPGAGRVRRLMRRQPPSHRLSADLRSDTVRVAGKTGSFLTLRHEIGVAETDDGDAIALVALTRSDVRSFVAPGVDAAIAAAARDAVDLLLR